MARVFFANQDDIQSASLEEFSNEKELVDLIEKHPELLPAEEILGLEDEEEINDLPAFLVLKREVGVDAGSIDLLLADQDATPTVVEAKLGDNREIRRKVIGQGLEYIADLSLKQAKDIWKEAQSYYSEKGRGLTDVFQKFYSKGDEIVFLEQLDKNLREGKIQLIILADELPLETRRVIQFLNKNSELLIFGVEIQKIAVGKNSKIYIIDVIGPSEEEREIKGRKPSYSDCLMTVKARVLESLKQADSTWRFEPASVTAQPTRGLYFFVLPTKLPGSTKDEGFIGYHVRVQESGWEAGFTIRPNKGTTYVQKGKKLYEILRQHQSEINKRLDNPEWEEYPLVRKLSSRYNSWGCSREELATKLAPEISRRMLEWMQIIQPIIKPVLQEFQERG